MSRFFIVDQSMCKAAGHHFDYTRNVAIAANENGYQTTVGANCSFANCNSSGFAADDIRCCFKNTTYSSLSHLHGLRSLTRSPQPPSATAKKGGWFARRTFKKYARQRASFVEQFSMDCQRFFAGTEFTSDDQIFFVTMSELECEGLARFFAESTTARNANWHLQFHFELFPASTKQTLTNDVFEKLKTSFQSLQNQFSSRVYFYTTSAGLSQQYNSLDAFQFKTLAYPVNIEFFEHRKTNSDKTQVACFGGIRREKGLKSLVPLLIRLMMKNPRVQQKIELVLQGKPSELPRQVQRDSPGIRWVPMPADNYVELVHEANIGLLYYDRETFANRVSSTLFEFLCAGKPVIVSSGSWLHEQIQSPIAEYQSAIFDQSTIIFATDNPHDNSLSLSLDVSKFRKKDRLIVIKFQTAAANFHQQHLIATAKVDGQTISEKMEAISTNHLSTGDQLNFSCCSALPENADTVDIRFSSAELGKIEITNIEIGVHQSESPIPRSQAAMVVTSEEAVFEAITHIDQQLEHFQRTACEFSDQIQTLHRPEATFQQLIQRSNSAV